MSIFLPVEWTTAERVRSSVDLDQIPGTAAINLGLHCLLGLILFTLKLLAPYIPVSTLHKSTSDRYRPDRIPVGPITVRCGLKQNAS